MWCSQWAGVFPHLLSKTIHYRQDKSQLNIDIPSWGLLPKVVLGCVVDGTNHHPYSFHICLDMLRKTVWVVSWIDPIPNHREKTKCSYSKAQVFPISSHTLKLLNLADYSLAFCLLSIYLMIPANDFPWLHSLCVEMLSHSLGPHGPCLSVVV